VFATLTLAPGACAGHPESSAAKFAQNVITRQLNGDPGFAWARLDPAEQRLVTRAHYSRCVLAGIGDQPPRFTVRVVGESPVRLHRRGISERQADRVHLWVTAMYKTKTESVGPWAVDVVRPRGSYRWLLDRFTEVEYRHFRADPSVCPS
jgi:hypothetical protein